MVKGMDMVSFNIMMDHIIRDNGERTKCTGKGNFIILVRGLLMMEAFMKMIFMGKGSFIIKFRVRKARLLMSVT